MQKIEDNLKDLNIIRKTIERPNHLHSMRRRYLEQELRAREVKAGKTLCLVIFRCGLCSVYLEVCAVVVFYQFLDHENVLFQEILH